MHFHEEPVDCPDCGVNTSFLYHLIDRSTDEQVLMCETCYEVKDDGTLDDATFNF